jgi:flagellar hook-length control protein FliK
MPTVSTGGPPLPAIGPAAAAASRHMTPADGRFEALLAPIAAELGKGGSKSAQPETLAAQDRSAEPHNQPADQPKAAIQPVPGATENAPRNADDGAKAQPTQAASTMGKTGEIGDAVVLDAAAMLRNSVAADSGQANAPDAARLGPEATPIMPPPVEQGTEPVAVAAAVASVGNAIQGQNESSPTVRDAVKDAAPVSSKVAPQSGGRPATTDDSRTKADEQNSGIASSATPVDSVALAESATAVATAPGAAKSSEASSSVVSVVSETPVEAPAGKHASVRPQVASAKAPRVTATVADVTASKHASAMPQLVATSSSPDLSAAAAVGAHISLNSHADVPRSSPVTSTGASPDANVVALAQPDAANLPPLTVAVAGVHASTKPQVGAGDSSAVTPGGAVAAVTADTHTAAMPPLDQTNSQPVPAPTEIAGNGIIAASAPQNQPRDAHSDSMTPPLYTAGVATPTAQSDATIAPPSSPFTPPTGTATQQVAMHVAQSLNDGGKTVTVELHPAELGRVEIHFSFHSDGMNVRLTVDRPETFDAFSHDRSGLQQQLAQAGVDLGGGGLELRLSQQQPDQSGSYSGGRTPRVAMPTPQPDAMPATLWVSNSLLDILA